MFLKTLDDLMGKKDINKHILAKESGIPYTTIDGWYKKGYDNVKLSSLRRIANYFGVTLDYLVYGKENGRTVQHSVAETYNNLDEHGKYIVRLVCGAESDRVHKKTISTRFVDLYHMPVSAGDGVYLDGYEKEPIAIENTDDAIQADYALRVSGDSMTPTYNDGDIVLVRTTPDVPDGVVGVFIHNGNGYIKRRSGMELVSDNKKYAPIEATEDTVVKGRVLGKAIVK